MSNLSYDDVVVAIMELDGMVVGKFPGLPGTVELIGDLIMFRTYEGVIKTIYEAVPQSCTFDDYWEISIIKLDH